VTLRLTCGNDDPRPTHIASPCDVGLQGWEEVGDYPLEWAATHARISSPA